MVGEATIYAPALTMCLPRSESGILNIDGIEIYGMEHLIADQKAADYWVGQTLPHEHLGLVFFSNLFEVLDY